MLARFERLMEQAVEGSLRRVFPTPLQPVQLAKAAARAMEQAQVVGVRGPEVPNRYELRVAPTDLERFGEYSRALADQVRTYLEDYARERGLRMIAEPRVEVVPDAGQRRGTVRASARFADLAPGVQHEIDEAAEGTRRLGLADLAAAHPTRGSRVTEHLWLADGADLRVALEPDGCESRYSCLTRGKNRGIGRLADILFDHGVRGSPLSPADAIRRTVES